MIRSSLDLVPTVIPRVKIEADALAAKQNVLARQGNQQAVVINKYEIAGAPDTNEKRLDNRVFLVFHPSVEYSSPPDVLVSDAPRAAPHWTRGDASDEDDDNNTNSSSNNTGRQRDVAERRMYTGEYYKDSAGQEEGKMSSPLGALADLHRQHPTRSGPFVSLPISDGLDLSSSTFFILSRERHEHGVGESSWELEQRQQQMVPPSMNGKSDSLLNMSFLSSAPHTLREERVAEVRTGRSISTAWQSDFDAKKVNFKKNYIDRDDDDADGGEGGDFGNGDGSGGGDGSGKRDRRSRGKKPMTLLEIYKKQRMEAGDIDDGTVEKEVDVDTREEDEEELTGKTKKKNITGNSLKETKSSAVRSSASNSSGSRQMQNQNTANASSSSLSSSLAPSGHASQQASVSPSAHAVPANAQSELTAHTMAAIADWRGKNITQVKFTDATKEILKGLSEYQDMKAKHLNPQTKPVAAEWFRVSQLRVRQELTQAGCTIDSNGFISLS